MMEESGGQHSVNSHRFLLRVLRRRRDIPVPSESQRISTHLRKTKWNRSRRRGKNSFSFRIVILRRTWYCATAAFGIIAHSVTIIATSVIIVVFMFILVRRILCVESRVCLRLSTCCLSPRLLSLSLLLFVFSSLRRSLGQELLFFSFPPSSFFSFSRRAAYTQQIEPCIFYRSFFSFPFFYTIFYI